MRGYKLAAFDLDETLLRPDASLSDYSAGVLRELDKRGIKIVPCTGRPYAGTLAHLKKIGLDTPGVFCNGAQIRYALSGEVLDECPLPLADARKVIELGLEAGGHPRVYVNDRVYVTHFVEADERYAKRTGSVIEPVGDLLAFLDRPPLKIMNLMPDAESIPPLIEKSRKIFGDAIYITQSLSTYVEYMHSGATKGKGLKKLAARWNISKEEIVAAGDHLNDLEMFREAGFSIAPANAQSATREAASRVCASNADDGVAHQFAEIFGLNL